MRLSDFSSVPDEPAVVPFLYEVWRWCENRLHTAAEISHRSPVREGDKDPLPHNWDMLIGEVNLPPSSSHAVSEPLTLTLYRCYYRTLSLDRMHSCIL